MCVGIIVKQFHHIKERCADDGVAADADAGGLPDAKTCELIDGFVGQRAAAANHANVALLVNAAGHDPNFAFAWRYDAGAVQADEPRLVKVYGSCCADHVNDGNALGDADDEWNFGIGGFKNRVSSIGRRNKNHGSIGAGSLHCLLDGIENGTLQVFRAALPWSNSAHDVGAILNHLLRVESAFTAGKALYDQASPFIDEHAHRAPPARATTFCAPSFMPFAMVKFSPLSRRICCPSSTLVPSIRTTTGTFTCKSFAAATTPVARTSHRRIPPKILMNTAFTPGSPIKIRNAFFT